jgi:hypothetical protein
MDDRRHNVVHRGQHVSVRIEIVFADVTIVGYATPLQEAK